MRRAVPHAVAIVAWLAFAPAAEAVMRASYLYPLADSVGKLTFGWASLAWDGAASELYVVDNRNGVVDVFNDNGMVVHSFGDSAGFGSVYGVAVLENGDPLVLSAQGLLRCNFRGEPAGRIEPRDLPAAFAADFHPDRVFVAQGRIYLADQGSMKVLVVAPDGASLGSYDLAQLAGLEESHRRDALMRGFSVDREGNMLFTVATLFRAFVVSPDGFVRAFGQKGSMPGRFNVVGGIVADEEGHLFLADTLRCVVMVFDRESFGFLGEFGYRGRGPGNLINPLEIAVGNGRVYVTQSVGAVKAYGVLFE